MLKSEAVSFSQLVKSKRAKTLGVKSGSAQSSSRPESKGRVAVVGVGRVGTTLAGALEGAGFSIELVVARHASSAARAARSLGSRVRATTSRQLSKEGSDALFRANLILICTPDDEIAKAARQVAAILSKRGATGIRPVALHVSGALSSSVLQPLKEAGFGVGSLHPLVSIADKSSPVSIISGAHFAIEGDRLAANAARSIVKALRGHGFTIDTEMKPLYHAAAVMASGNLVALYDVAIGMMEECGLSAKEARKALLPLLTSTVENLKSKPPAAALTGPFARGDIQTARTHLKSLAASDLSEATTIYLALAQHALKMSSTKSSAGGSDAIAKLLSHFQHTRAR